MAREGASRSDGSTGIAKFNLLALHLELDCTTLALFVLRLMTEDN